MEVVVQVAPDRVEAEPPPWGSLRLHPAAFADLALAHRPALLLMLRRLLPNPADAEDVLQETLLHAYIGLRTLRRPEALAAWLRTIAYNRAMQWQRRRYREAAAQVRLWTRETGDGGIGDAIARLDAEAALAALPPPDREAVALRHLRGWTSQEIARVQGSLAATVRWRLARARRALRTALDEGKE